jgi:hypothetical protein
VGKVLLGGKETKPPEDQEPYEKDEKFVGFIKGVVGEALNERRDKPPGSGKPNGDNKPDADHPWFRDWFKKKD